MVKKEKLKEEIISSLQAINNTAVYLLNDNELRNSICRELRKIHSRLDKLTQEESKK